MKAVRCRDGSQLGSPLYSQRTPVVVELGLGNESRCRFHSTLNILEAMRSHKVKKIIYAASSSCYGVPKKYPTSELELINPKYPYAFSNI